MTTTAHKLITLSDNHSVLGLGPYSTASARQTATLTSADVGKVALQTNTSPPTMWTVLAVASGVGTWSRVDTGPEITFTGDFAALAATFGLTVQGFYRADLGVTGTTGTGASAWANQSGGSGAMSPASGTTNGIGTAGAGLNGKASLIMDGSTQGTIYTMTAQVAPATTNFHKWWVGRSPSTPASNGYVFADNNGNAGVYCASGQTSPAANLTQVNTGVSATTTGAVINQWYRGRASYTGSASDVIRYGAHAPAAASAGNTAPVTVRHLGTGASANRLNYEFLCYLEIEGTLANFLSFDAAAGPAAQGFWTSAIEI